MVRSHHLKVPSIQHHAPTTTVTSASSSTTSSPTSTASAVLSPLSIRIPAPNLFHPLISETSINAAAVSDRIPGFKASAAFLASLRANLALSSALLDPSDLRYSSSNNPSLCNTPSFGPTTMTSSAGSLPPPSPSQVDLAVSTEKDVLAGVPPLTTYVATGDDDLVDALRLVGDSVAQQRQFSNRQLIFHPAIVAVWVALLALVAQFLYKGHRGDLLLVGTTWAGLLVAVLLAIRLVTTPYIELAEETGTWKWLGKDSEVIVTKFGDEIIGTTVVLISKTDSNLSNPNTISTQTGNSSKKHRKSNSSIKLRGLIRAWTVKRRYRGKGIGGGLLEEAVRLCKSKGVTPSIGAIEFADDHANSTRVLPHTGYWRYLRFNDAMDRREDRAREVLDTIVEESMSEKEKRRTLKERGRRSS